MVGIVSVVGVLFAIGAAVFLAGQALTIRLATNRGKTVDILLVVMAVNVLVLGPTALVLDPDPVITTRSVVAFAAAGIAGTMLGRILFYSGIKRIGASRAEPIKASMPLHATILAVLFLGETVTTGQFAGVFLLVIALVSWEGSRSSGVGDRISATGLAFPLLAAFMFALEPIFATVGLQQGTSVFFGLTIKTVAAMAVFVGYLTWDRSLPRLTAIPRSELRWYVAAGVMSTGFLLSYYAGLSVSRVGVIVPIMQTSPLIVIALAALFLRDTETVTVRLVLSALVVVAGAVVVTVTG